MRIFSAGNLTDADFDQILSFLRSGGVIGFPTDTAYGLGADPYNDAALRRIFAIKGRPETKPILLLVDSMEMVERIAVVSREARLLAEHFWPGPLTMVLPALDNAPRTLTAGGRSIGVRMPDAPFARRLTSALAKPVTATSANRSSRPACVTAEEVQAQLGAELDVLIDGGALPARGGSTVLDLTTDPPLLVREGPTSLKSLNEILSGRILRKTDSTQ